MEADQQQWFTMSPTIGAIAAALADAQGQIQGAKKDSENPHFKSKYADLASVWDACRGPLSTNKLAVTQLTEPYGEDGVCVVTLLSHASGEWIRGRLFMPVSKKDAHGFGSAITYARRFALAAMVGVAPEDDDANGTLENKVVSGPAISKAKTQTPSGEFAEKLARCKTADEMLALANELRQQHTEKKLSDDAFTARKQAWNTRMSELGTK